MQRRAVVALLIPLLSVIAFSQDKPQKQVEDQTIRISTELVQIDVVVTDKNGQIVRGLTREDFTLHESGKKQQVSFFEFVEAGKKRQLPEAAAKDNQPQPSPRELDESEVKRVFAFIVDDLTIQYEDLLYLRQMLTNFIDHRMQDGDLVAIVRTAGGKGLLQQYTGDKQLLRRTVESLTLSTHRLSAFHNPELDGVQNSGVMSLAGEGVSINDQQEDTNKSLRAFMSLGTASFLIEGLGQLPGRKSVVLISGGIPIFNSQSSAAGNRDAEMMRVESVPGTAMSTGTVDSHVIDFLNQLTDKAARAGVAIHTMDIRGLQAHAGVVGFDQTPARSGIRAPLGRNSGTGFGRTVDESLFGSRSSLDALESHQGLRKLSADTGGVAVVSKNNFATGLERILAASEGYYLLAYTPSDAKFDGDFRRIEVKVKGDYKVYSRRGYFAREEKAAASATKQDQMLAAVRSPLARRAIDFDAMVLYKAAPTGQGAIDIHLLIEPKKLQFTEQDGKQCTDLDVAIFVFDELGKLRGGKSDTITAGLMAEEYQKVKASGLTYLAGTTLAPGAYQVRLAVRDNKTGNIGTLSRFLEVPDLSKGRLSASSVLLAAVPQKDTRAVPGTPISANRQISRKQDLRYAVVIYNPKLKDGKPQVRTQLIISQNGQVIFKEEEQGVAASQGNAAQIVKVGQLGLGGVKAGRYTLTMVITDPLADKKAQSISRSMDFVVVD